VPIPEEIPTSFVAVFDVHCSFVLADHSHSCLHRSVSLLCASIGQFLSAITIAVAIAFVNYN
jgi:hypothetical protein